MNGVTIELSDMLTALLLEVWERHIAPGARIEEGWNDVAKVRWAIAYATQRALGDAGWPKC